MIDQLVSGSLGGHNRLLSYNRGFIEDVFCNDVA